MNPSQILPFLMAAKVGASTTGRPWRCQRSIGGDADQHRRLAADDDDGLRKGLRACHARSWSWPDLLAQIWALAGSIRSPRADPQ